jgi:hypothetical protein
VEQYLHYWWAGELQQHYALYGLTMLQVNKLIKLAQYVVGLVAVFELIQFSVVMNRLRVFSSLYFYIAGFAAALLNSFNLISRLAVGLLLVITRRMSLREALHRTFFEHVFAAASAAEQESTSHPLVKAFHWLERHPLAENWRKGIIFLSFAILSLADIFTS